MVVLHGHQAAGLLGGPAQGVPVDGLDRVQVDHPYRDALPRQRVRGGQGLGHRDARRQQRHAVPFRGTQDLAAADGELLAGAVDHGALAARGAQVPDAVEVRHRGDQTRGLVGVTGVEHRRAVHRPHHRQVLEAHLAGPVLADGDPGVRADEVDAGTADRRHADEVVGAGQEGGEGGGVGHPAARRRPHRRGHHLLLGDVALDVAFGMLLGEELRACGVADLPVQDHDVAAHGAEGGQRLTEGVPCRHLLALVPPGRFGLPGAHGVQHAGGGRFRHPHAQVAGAAEFGDRLVGIRQRLAVHPLAVLHRLDALALEGAGEDHGRLPLGGGRLPYARSTASTSCPSTSMACQPKASKRRAYASRSWPCRVGPRWPSRFTSTRTVRLSRFSYAACSAASHTEPSASSLSPHITHTR